MDLLWGKYIELIKPLRKTNKFALGLMAAIMVSLTTTGAVLAVVTGKAAQSRAMVAFVGDSNFVKGSGYLASDLTFGPQWNMPNHVDDNYILIFALRSGSGIRTPDCAFNTDHCPTHNYWQTKLKTMFSKTKPDAIVTDLGINDSTGAGVSDSLGYSNYDQKIDWFMNLMPAGKPVFWVNTPCQVEPTDYKVGCQIINQALFKAPSRWPNLTIIDWGDRANTHPEYMDKIHYSVTGYRKFSKIITQSLDARFPRN